MRRARHGVPARRGRGRAGALLDPGRTPSDMVGRLPRHRHAPAAPARATSTPWCTTAAHRPFDARRRPPHRVGRRGHEGRRGAVARADARAGRAARAVRGGGDPARERRGVADGAFIHAERFAGVRRVPVLRGRRADRARRRGRDRQAEGGGDAARGRARALVALRLGARARAAARLLALRRRRQLVASAQRPARDRTGSPRCPRSCARATPSTSCPPRASCSATCAPTGSRRSTRCSRRSRASTRRSGSSRPWCARGPDWTRARPPLTCSPTASERLGRPIVGLRARRRERRQPHRGRRDRLTIDGLGPLGGGAHTPDEWVSADSLTARRGGAAVAHALLGPPRPPARPPGASASAPGSAWRDLMSSLR